MFGYIKANRPELKLRQDEYYRALYCGLCRTMGKCTGQCSRLTLSYDFTYLALIRMALSGDRPKIEKRRCLLHPIKKRNIATRSPELEYCAYASAILGYYKLADDRDDEKGLRKLRAHALHPCFSSFRKKAIKKQFDELDLSVARCLTELKQIENERPESVDVPAEIFGHLMSVILSFGFEDGNKKIAEDIGRHIGRWIYIIDAADDYAADQKNNRYNPLRCLYNDESFGDERREQVRIALLNELCECERAIDLLDTSDSSDVSGLIENIMYLGLPLVAQKILFPKAESQG